MIHRYIGILGLMLFLLIAYILSNNRRLIKPKLIIWGLVLQFSFALIIMKTTVGVEVFGWMATIITLGLAKANAGTEFVPDETIRSKASGSIAVSRALAISIATSS